MNRIGNLQTLFTSVQASSTQASATSETSSAVATRTGATSARSNIVLGGTVAGNAADSTTVSTAGGTLLAAVNGPDIRADKVAQLQAAIAGGTYKVAAGDVADSLIQSMLGRS